jgi:hypothetical protein
MKINWINKTQFEVIPTDGYDSIQRFTNYAYPEREIILETHKNGEIKPRETHIYKNSEKIINLIDREKELLTGELELDDTYLMKYNRIIRENGFENEIQEIINKNTKIVEQWSESHLANRDIQGDEPRKRSFNTFLLMKTGRENHKKIMSKEYANWSNKEKINFWHGRLSFQERMQTQVSNGIGNFGLYIMNSKYKEELLQYEKNWDSFLYDYCKHFKIDISIGKRLFELSGSKEKEWIELARKVGCLY